MIFLLNVLNVVATATTTMTTPTLTSKNVDARWSQRMGDFVQLFLSLKHRKARKQNFCSGFFVGSGFSSKAVKFWPKTKTIDFFLTKKAKRVSYREAWNEQVTSLVKFLSALKPIHKILILQKRIKHKSCLGMVVVEQQQRLSLK